MRVEKTRGERQPTHPPPQYDKTWFPTPETWQKLDKLRTLQKKTFEDVAEMQNRDLPDPQIN